MFTAAGIRSLGLPAPIEGPWTLVVRAYDQRPWIGLGHSNTVAQRARLRRAIVALERTVQVTRVSRERLHSARVGAVDSYLHAQATERHVLAEISATYTFLCSAERSFPLALEAELHNRYADVATALATALHTRSHALTLDSAALEQEDTTPLEKLVADGHLSPERLDLLLIARADAREAWQDFSSASPRIAGAGWYRTGLTGSVCAACASHIYNVDVDPASSYVGGEAFTPFSAADLPPDAACLVCGRHSPTPSRTRMRVQLAETSGDSGAGTVTEEARPQMGGQVRGRLDPAVSTLWNAAFTGERSDRSEAARALLAVLLDRGAPLEAGALLDATDRLPQQGVFRALAEPASPLAAQTLVDVVDEADGYRLRVLFAGLRGRTARDTEGEGAESDHTGGLTFAQHPLVRARLRVLLTDSAYLQRLMWNDGGPDVPRFRAASLAEGIVVVLIVGAPAVADLIALASMAETGVALAVARRLPLRAEWIPAVIPVLLARNEPEIRLAALKQLYGPHEGVSFWEEHDNAVPLARCVTTLLDNPDPALWRTAIDVLATQLADLAGIKDTAISAAAKEAITLAMLSHEHADVRAASFAALFGATGASHLWPSPPVVQALAAMGRSSEPAARATAQAGLWRLAQASPGPHSAACRATLQSLVMTADQEVARAAHAALSQR